MLTRINLDVTKVPHFKSRFQQGTNDRTRPTDGVSAHFFKTTGTIF